MTVAPGATSRLDRAAVLAVVVTLGALVAHAAGTDAAFAVPTTNAGNTFSADPDWQPPLIARAATLKAEGGIPGYVRAGGSYTVLAAVTDDPSSNPPAGVGGVQGDVSALTTGVTGVPLPAAATTSGGQTWSHRSATATVPADRAAGSYPGNVTARDAASPVNTSALSFTTVVDNTAPTRTGATTANGGVPGLMDAGDSITYRWSEVVDPQSVLAGWTGAPVPVTVQATNNALLVGETVTVRDATNSTQLPLGTIDTNLRDYVTAATTFGGPGNATRSTMAWDATTGAVTVRFGPPDVSGTTTGNGGMNDYSWSPAVVFDRAGNLSDTTTYTDPGGAARGF